MARSKKKLKNNFSDSVDILEGLERCILKSRKKNVMHTQEDGDSFVLTPCKEDYKSKEPYFLTLKNEECVLIPDEMFLEILELLHASYEDRFCMQLEREIARQMPRDFEDIWEVAIAEIKKSKKGFLRIDPASLVAFIKKQHPHLFMRLDFDSQ